MDLSKLDHISTEGLQALRDRCVEILAKRKTSTLRRGVIAWFMDRDGNKRHIYVTRINAKTVSGEEVDSITRVRNPLKTWRVTPALLNVMADPTPTRPVPAHRPSTLLPSSW